MSILADALENIEKDKEGKRERTVKNVNETGDEPSSDETISIDNTSIDKLQEINDNDINEIEEGGRLISLRFDDDLPEDIEDPLKDIEGSSSYSEPVKDEGHSDTEPVILDEAVKDDASAGLEGAFKEDMLELELDDSSVIEPSEDDLKGDGLIFDQSQGSHSTMPIMEMEGDKKEDNDENINEIDTATPIDLDTVSIGAIGEGHREDDKDLSGRDVKDIEQIGQDIKDVVEEDTYKVEEVSNAGQEEDAGEIEDKGKAEMQSDGKVKSEKVEGKGEETPSVNDEPQGKDSKKEETVSQPQDKGQEKDEQAQDEDKKEQDQDQDQDKDQEQEQDKDADGTGFLNELKKKANSRKINPFLKALLISMVSAISGAGVAFWLLSYSMLSQTRSLISNPNPSALPAIKTPMRSTVASTANIRNVNSIPQKSFSGPSSISPGTPASSPNMPTNNVNSNPSAITASNAVAHPGGLSRHGGGGSGAENANTGVNGQAQNGNATYADDVNNTMVSEAKGAQSLNEGANATSDKALNQQANTVDIDMTTLHLLGIAEKLRQANKLERASYYYRQYLSHNQHDEMAWNNLGAIEIKRGRYEEALSVLDRAISIAPDNNILRLNFSIAALKAGQGCRARQNLFKLNINELTFEEKRLYNAIKSEINSKYRCGR